MRPGNKEVEMNFYTISGLDRELKLERMCSRLRRVCLEDEWVVQDLHTTGNLSKNNWNSVFTQFTNFLPIITYSHYLACLMFTFQMRSKPQEARFQLLSLVQVDQHGRQERSRENLSYSKLIQSCLKSFEYSKNDSYFTDWKVFTVTFPSRLILLM